jgi:hypothetical protein
MKSKSERIEPMGLAREFSMERSISASSPNLGQCDVDQVGFGSGIESASLYLEYCEASKK